MGTATVSSGVNLEVGDAHLLGQASGGGPPSSVDRAVDLRGGNGQVVPGRSETYAHVGASTVRFALDKFDGSGSWESFATKFQALADLGNWTEQEQKIRLIHVLDGPAMQVFWGLEKSATVHHCWSGWFTSSAQPIKICAIVPRLSN